MDAHRLPRSALPTRARAFRAASVDGGDSGPYNEYVRLLAVVFALAAAGVSSGAQARLPPLPESPSVPAASTWKLPIAFTAWGFQDGLFTAKELADRLVDAGIRSIAIQIDQGGPRATRPDAEIFKRAGLDLYLWGIPDAGDHESALEAFEGIVDGYIAQVENDDQYRALLAILEAGVGENLPRAVVTTFEGINTTRNGLIRTPERMQPLTAAGITTAFVECYRQDDESHSRLSLMTWQAGQYGWSHAVPVIGLFRGDRLRDYKDLGSFGRVWGFWNVEQIHPDDWRVLAATTRPTRT
jgi:hypothetical protein